MPTPDIMEDILQGSITVQGIVWYKANSVGKVLGYSNPAHTVWKARQSLPKGTVSTGGVLDPALTNLNDQKAVYFNARALRSFVAMSRQPLAFELATAMGIDTVMKHTYDELDTIGAIQRSFPRETSVRQFVVHPYRVDLYFPEINTVVECDEHGHAAYDRLKEASRERFICLQMKGARFVRFNPHSKTFDIFAVIGQISSLFGDRRPINV